jgi:uncharacterized lipoprotein YmbA
MIFQKYFFICIFGLLLTGCVKVNLTATSTPTQFYVLTAPELNEGGHIARDPNEKKIIGLGPVRLPNYLSRLPIVTKKGKNEVEFSEFHRWAEPFQKGIERVIAENLSRMQPDAQVNLYPWLGNNKRDYDVYIVIYEFIADLETKEVILSGSREVKKAGEVIDHGTVTIRKPLIIEVPLKDKDYQHIAETMSCLLTEWLYNFEVF